MPYDWSNDIVIKFLELLETERVIWDVNDNNHKQKHKVHDAWKRLSDALVIPIEELKSKKKSLMATFRPFLKKKNNSMRSGPGVEDIFKPIWFAFDTMERFLGPTFTVDDTVNTEGELISEKSDRMSNTYDSRRSTRPVQRGNPASGSAEDRRQHTGTRNQRRAYDYQQRNVAEDWSESREFEERPPKPRGPNQRSANWKKKQQEKKEAKKEKKDDASAAYDFKAVQETAPVDEPLYDIGPHSSSIPVQETYSQNFDFSGYIDQQG